MTHCRQNLLYKENVRIMKRRENVRIMKRRFSVISWPFSMTPRTGATEHILVWLGNRLENFTLMLVCQHKISLKNQNHIVSSKDLEAPPRKTPLRLSIPTIYFLARNVAAPVPWFLSYLGY